MFSDGVIICCQSTT